MIVVGALVGLTRLRTGENAAASSTAIHRSAVSSGCSALCGRLAEASGEFGREHDARLRRLRRQAQGTDDTADAERRIDVFDPQLQLFGLTTHERRLQFDVQRDGGLVAGDDRVVAGDDHAAQIAEIEVIHLPLGGFGTVEPFGDPQLRQELLGHLDDARLRHRRLALCLEFGVLFLHPERTAAMPWLASSAIGRCSSGISASTALRRALPGRRRFGFGR